MSGPFPVQIGEKSRFRLVFVPLPVASPVLICFHIGLLLNLRAFNGQISERIAKQAPHTIRRRIDL